MSFIGATGYNNFQDKIDELNTEIQNTSNYINSVVVAEGIVDSNLTTRITDLENDVGHQISISNPTASGLFLTTNALGFLIGNPSAVQQLGVNGCYGVCSGLAEDIEALETTLGEEQGLIDTLQSEMEAVEGSVGTLEGSVGTLEGEMTAIQGEMVVVQDALGIVAAETFASSFSSSIRSALGWLAGTSSVLTIAQILQKLDDHIEEIKDDMINLGSGSHNNDLYLRNSGYVGIGYSRNTQLSAKLHINGNFKCGDVNCDDIVADKIGLGTSTNHTGTLLDVRGNCSFGDSLTLVQAIALKSQSGVWHITSDNGGNGGNNQFVISSLRTIAGIPNVETEFLLIENGNGNIGVGKTPAYKLDVDGDVNCTGNFRVNGTLLNTSSSLWTETGNDIYYNTGSVGINISSPNTSYKLDVVGDVNITGNYKVDGTDLKQITNVGNGLSLNTGSLTATINYEDLEVDDESRTITTITTGNIQEPTYTSSSYITKTTLSSEYKYIKFENTPEIIWDFYPYNDATSWINYTSIIGATYSLANLQDWNGTFGVFTAGTTIGWIQFPPIPQGFNIAKIYFGNTHTDVVKLVINGNVIHTLSGVSSYVWNGSVNTGDVIRIEEVYSVIDGNIKIILMNEYSITFPENTTCDILVVAGGGGGGESIGGGGGAGGIDFEQNVTLNGTYSVLVGGGGIGYSTAIVGENGFNSKLSNSSGYTIEASGGGGAHGQSSAHSAGNGGGGDGGQDGGSGGGGTRYYTGGGDGVAGEGYTGGVGGLAYNVSPDWIFGGGGGGGAGGAGHDVVTGSYGGGGNGGVGRDFSGTFSTAVGVSGYFGGGGGGGTEANTITALRAGGGNGGGGDGGTYRAAPGGGYTTIYPSNGTAHTGGGGGGGGSSGGGNGGSGIVLIRYKYVDTTTSTTTSVITPTGYLNYDKNETGSYVWSFPNDPIFNNRSYQYKIYNMMYELNKIFVNYEYSLDNTNYNYLQTFNVSNLSERLHKINIGSSTSVKIRINKSSLNYIEKTRPLASNIYSNMKIKINYYNTSLTQLTTTNTTEISYGGTILDYLDFDTTLVSSNTGTTQGVSNVIYIELILKDNSTTYDTQWFLFSDDTAAGG